LLNSYITHKVLLTFSLSFIATWLTSKSYVKKQFSPHNPDNPIKTISNYQEFFLFAVFCENYLWQINMITAINHRW